MNTTEDFCSYEVAKLLKEKGFDTPLNYFYNSDGRKGYATSYNWNQTTGDFPDYSCPTHQMAMKWLRKKYNICIIIYPDKENGYEAVLYDIENDVEIVLQSFGVYGIHIYKEIYEEAVEAALKYSLENLI